MAVGMRLIDALKAVEVACTAPTATIKRPLALFGVMQNFLSNYELIS